MIDVNELRIGNWLNLIWESGRNVSQFIKIAGILPDSIMYPMDNQDGAWYPQALKQFAPIPITPEILKKAGFEHSYDSILAYQHAYENGYFILNAQFELTDKDGLSISKPLKSVHQIQNLYFALMGEELKINLAEASEMVT